MRRKGSMNLALCLAALLIGCGSIEPPVLLDEDGEPIALPGPYDTWLQIRSVTPAGGAVGLRPTIELTFTDYVDPATFTTYGVLALQSGGIIVAGTAQYHMADRTIRWTPRQDLEPGFAYGLVFVEQEIFSMTGAPLILPTRLPRFVADTTIELPDESNHVSVTFDAIAPLFAASCDGCHSDPRWGLPELRRDVLVNTPSTQVEAMLVRPFDPSRSYLMHKILPDYPRRRFTVQPPPWDEDARPLTAQEIRRIEAWIRQGAR